VQLNTAQVQTVNNLLSVYVDSSKTFPLSESARMQRKIRNDVVIDFIQSEYQGRLDSLQQVELNKIMLQFDNKDVGNYLTNKNLIIKSFFWLIGSDVYLEALLWSLFGVLVSLIYYVSIAYSKSLSITGDDDTGKFDPAELPSQIAKMFYAPACTIVIVLAYHLLSGKNGNMIDINVNKGLIIFSFICGFFSSRVMKFLDKLKDLVLPLSEKADNAPVTPPTKSDVSVQLKLSDVLAQSPDAAAIIEAGFNAATVTLAPEGGDPIELENPKDDQADLFLCKQVSPGKYILHAVYSFKKDESNIINMSAKQTVEVTTGNNAFSLPLDVIEQGG
jgi:hypothetical protein